jgi:hypothetical protein
MVERTNEPARRRRPLRVAQPESTAALRPCQQRAAARRATALERDRARDWLRRLAR